MTDKKITLPIRALAAGFKDEFQRLDRALFAREDKLGSSVVQFTSSHASEGVTSVALAFCAHLASIHDPDNIVAVEANLRRPSFRANLGLPGDASIESVLRGFQKVDEVMLPVSPYGFSAIPAEPTENREMSGDFETLLGNLGDLLGELRTRFRFIVVDTPPTIPFLDAAVICPMTDGVVLVVASNATRSEVVNHALDKLKEGGGRVLGVVLNKREYHIPKWLYHRV